MIYTAATEEAAQAGLEMFAGIWTAATRRSANPGATPGSA
jgi:hypothetical protein